LRFQAIWSKERFPHTNYGSALITILFAAFEKRFPLFLRSLARTLVDVGGKEASKKDFQIPRAFSTSFPQSTVDVEA
jgi:hypothetical protein